MSKSVPILSLKEKQVFFETSFQLLWFGNKVHSQFHINRLEDVVDHMHFPLPPHQQTVCDFFFLTRGSSVRSKGIDKYSFSADTFFFLPAYQISTHESISADAMGYYCHFDPDIFNGRWLKAAALDDFSFLSYNGKPNIKIDNTARKHVLNLLSRLEEEYTNKEQCDINVIRANLLTLLTEVNRFTSKEGTALNSAQRITEEYKTIVSKNIYKRFTLAEYASMLAISPNHLNKCVKSITGKTAQDLSSELVLLEAKMLLKQTPLTVNEIAWKIGREDVSDFIRFFRSKTGTTPTEYRSKD